MINNKIEILIDKQEIPPTIKTIIAKELLKYIIYLFLYNKIIPAVTHDKTRK